MEMLLDQKKKQKNSKPVAPSLEILENYLESAVSDMDSNPLQYWAQNKNSALSKLARIYLSPPAGSVPSERLFSVSGRIVRPDRSRLNPEKLNKMLVIKSYLYKKNDICN